MPLKKTVNDSLTRLTGYQVTRAQGTGASLSARQVDSLRATSSDLAATAKTMAATVRGLEAALKAARTESAKATARIRELEAAPEAARARGAKPAKPKADTFPHDYDEDFCDIIRAVRPYSMTGNDKLHALISATKYVSRFDIPGGIAAFGVWRGGDMKAVALTLEAIGDLSRDLYLYDTFEAMTPSTDPGGRQDRAPAAGSPDAGVKDTTAQAVASLKDVQARFTTGRYPQDRIHFVEGPVEETIPDQLPEQISILCLDTDFYESTHHEFQHAYERLASGGVLIIDDYGAGQGSRTATDEFLELTGERLLLLRMASGRVAVKP